MKGISFLGDRKLVIKDFEKPKPFDDEVLVRLKATGICGSDLNYVYRTPKEKMDSYVYGVWVSSKVIAGHEPTGIIEEVGDNVTSFKKGDKIIVHHISGCGVCKQCRAGNHAFCENDEKRKGYGFQINGGFADFMVAKEIDCVPLPDGLSFEEGAYYSCGAGTAFKVVKRLNISGYDNVSVFGLGPVGLASVLFAKKFGSKVIAVDPIDIRRKLAKDVGADYVIDPNNLNPVEEIMRITDGEGTSVGIECSANPTARSQILDVAKIWGKVAYVGEGGNVDIKVSEQIIHKQLTIIGSWVYTIPELIELTNFAVKEHIPLSKLITNKFKIDQAEKAFQIADSGKSGKIVFVWD